MDKHYTYLLINCLTIFFPIILSFDKKVHFYKSWKFIVPGLILTAALFLIWDYIFTIFDVWSFNPNYITGLYLLNLPIEEILFFITVPFSCIFIFECLNTYIKTDIFRDFTLPLTIGLLLLCIVMLVIYSSKLYTVITFGTLFPLLIYAAIIKKVAYLGRFYLAYIVSLIPFYLVNGILTALPVVLYNNHENMGVRLGSIPLEDHFYSMSMLLLNILFFEYFCRKKHLYE